MPKIHLTGNPMPLIKSVAIAQPRVIAALIVSGDACLTAALLSRLQTYFMVQITKENYFLNVCSVLDSLPVGLM